MIKERYIWGNRTNELESRYNLSDFLLWITLMCNAPIKLSPYSKVFYHEWKIKPSRSDYNIVVDQVFYGKLDPLRLQQAFKNFSKDYVLLHSKIIEKSGEYYWFEDDKITIALSYQDKPLNQEELLSYASKCFNLNEGPIFRALLTKLSEQQYRLIFVMHHLLMDAAKSDFIINSISNYYNKLGQQTVKLTEQRHLLTTLTQTLEKKISENNQTSQEFWQKALKDIEAINISFLTPTIHQDHSIQEYRFDLPNHLFEQTKKLKKQYCITPYLLGQIALAALIYRYTNQKIIGISYPISIREGSDFIYGAHVNTNIIAYRFHHNTTIINAMEQAKSHFKQVKNGKHHYHLIENILSSANYSNLLDVNFIQTAVVHNPLNFDGINRVEVNHLFEIDLPCKLLFAQEIKDGTFNYYVKYNGKYIDQELLILFVDHYKHFLTEIVEDLLANNIDKKIDDYSIISRAEHQRVIDDWNYHPAVPESCQTLHELFEQQAATRPQHTALIYDNERITYSMLNQQANQLAHYLLEQYSIQADQLIALYLDKNINLAIAVLAVLKAGGAYVPIDPSYPDNRVQYIIADTKTPLVLSNANYQSTLKALLAQGDHGGTRFHNNLDLLDVESIIAKNRLIQKTFSNPITHTKSHHLCYVTYTSGSTGTPKGVLQQHDNVTGLFASTASLLEMSDKDTWLFFHSYAFDFSVWEIWGAWLHGGCLLIPNAQQNKDMQLLYELCQRHKVTILNQTPKAFYEFADVATSKLAAGKLTSLAYIILGGDALAPHQLNNWFSAYATTSPQIINMYGTTETTVHNSYHLISSTESNASEIGRALPGKKLFVLDKQGKPLPIGAVGELHAGGSGLARGYLNQSALTTERFIANPFQTEQEKIQGKNARLYKTGDLARWLPHGSLAYVGRNDKQIKLRGYRIELGEIENQLLNYPGIKQAVIIEKTQQLKHKSSQDNYLVAYYVADQKISATTLENYLLSQLPNYMVPAQLIALDKLPLTANGKLDHSALPPTEFQSRSPYVAPRNTIERIVVTAFQDTLEIDQVGINDNFFELGGESIKAIRLVSTLQQHLSICVADIFNYKTPQKIIQHTNQTNNFLHNKLQQIKKDYKNKPQLFCNGIDNSKIDNYLATIDTKGSNSRLKKSIKHVLLTGATGYLGCYLLNKLIMLTDYNIYVIIRGTSVEAAVQRLVHKYQYYFTVSLTPLIDQRIIVMAGDLSEAQLGLTNDNYNHLVTNVDSVLHAAALVKHYGEYETSYRANVLATKNLLAFTAMTRLKDFHHISTISVLTEQTFPHQHRVIMTEDDQQPKGQLSDNMYISTKHQAEQLTLEYRKLGVRSNIYRIGNLAFASNGRIQENYNENAFFSQVQCFVAFGMIAPEFSSVEISPVDTTAQAIIDLMACQQLNNAIFHVVNPYRFDMAEFFKHNEHYNVKLCDISAFMERLITYLDNPRYQQLTQRFLLHRGWLNEPYRLTNPVQVLQERTHALLQELTSEWTPINESLFQQYLSHFNLQHMSCTSL